MQNPGTIVVSLQEGQERSYIRRSAVGLRNHKDLTNDMIAVGWAEEIILNTDH
jgi:hypothetical protein